MDTPGVEPGVSRMLSGCDTTTPCAPWWADAYNLRIEGQVALSPRAGPYSQQQSTIFLDASIHGDMDLKRAPPIPNKGRAPTTPDHIIEG